MTRRAAQNASSSRSLVVGRRRRARLPRLGIERVALEAADGGEILVVSRLPGAEAEPEGEQPAASTVRRRRGTPNPRSSRAARWRRRRTSSRRPAGSDGRWPCPPSVTTVSSVLPAFMSVRLVQAPKTRRARSSRRCSCGTTSLGSSGRVPSYLKPPSTLPGSRRPAAARYEPSGRRSARSRISLTSLSRQGRAVAGRAARRRGRGNLDRVAAHRRSGSTRPGCSRAPRRSWSRPRPLRSRLRGSTARRTRRTTSGRSRPAR